MLHSIRGWLGERVVRPGVRALSGITAAGLKRYVPGNDAYAIFERHGYHLLKKHYYLPIPEPADIDGVFRTGPSEMVGVEMNETGARALLHDVFPNYTEEFRRLFPLTKPDRGHRAQDFYLLNGNFMAVDAHVYYIFIRHFKPRRIVEIGSGYSTLVAAAAVRKVAEDTGKMPELVAIEPYPLPFLKTDVAGISEVIESKVQDVGMEVFTSLRAGDILFIDSTHVLREGGDVQFEYCEVLPRLAPGVIVHIHDISLPNPYPRVYFEKHHYFWNEQYLLQSFLAFNSRFEVLWPGSYIWHHQPEAIREVFPEFDVMREAYPNSEPSSFWMRVRNEPQ